MIAAVLFVASATAVDYKYVFDSDSYDVAPGGTVDVLVYLQETGTSVLKDDGLIGAGVKIRFDDPPLPGDPAEILSIADIVNISDFELVWSQSAQPGAGFADLSLGTFGFAYGAETSLGSGVYRLPLGKFTFTAGAAPSETTHIRATDFSDITDDTVYYRNGDPLDPVALDGLIQDGTTAITTVPEPSALAMIGMAALSIAAFRYYWLQLRAREQP